LAEARSFLGTPYHHKGRVKGVGVDCGGLLYEVYSKFFPLKPYPAQYAMDWALHRGDELYLDWIAEYVEPASSPVPGGLVVFRLGRCFAHGGIVTDRGRVIHAWGSQQRGSVIESPMSFFVENGRPRQRRYFALRSGR
jgi:cell wall-associated NlpC family hydrolase